MEPFPSSLDSSLRGHSIIGGSNIYFKLNGQYRQVSLQTVLEDGK